MAEQQEPQKGMQNEQTKGFFRKQAADRLSSPDDLDQYLTVTSPSIWLVLLGVTLLISGLLAWGFFGSAASTISTASVRIGDKVFCYVTSEQVGQIQVGDSVRVGDVDTTVSNVAAIPLSRDEVHSIVNNDYLVEALLPGNWGYEIDFADASALPEGVPLTTAVTTERIAPVTLMFGSGA